jgi:pentatricopeptide repeat protein
LGTIINDYAADKTEESLKSAEDFLQSLVNGEPAERDWDMPSGARRSALEIIYHPLMDAYAKENRTEDAERLFKNMLDCRGEPTLGTLTVLLDAYRRSGDIEAVRQVWPQIFQLGLKHSQASSLTGEELVEDSMPISPKPSAILCIPLSIYIDALSTAGYHLEIAETWKKFQINNFAFDSHNWNHLTVALVRAGEPERAFEVLERVILPYQRQADSMYVPRDKWPNSPLTFNAATPPSPQVDYLSNPFVESPMHNMRRRGFAVGQATKRLQQWLGDKKDKPDDFAHPLHVLQQISPSWGTWTPHTVTLGVLSKVLAHLSSGRMIQPLNPEEDSEVPRVFEDEATIRTKQELAAEILRRIYTDFPGAVRVVEDQELRERSRTEQQLEFEQQRDILWT